MYAYPHMKRIILTAAALFAASLAFAQSNADAISYALPQTVIKVKYTVRQTIFHAGPFAAYAEEYLGIDARMYDSTVESLESIRLSSRIEACQDKRYNVFVADNNLPAQLVSTPQGLVSSIKAVSGSGSLDWEAGGTSSAQRLEAAAAAQGVFASADITNAEALAARIKDLREQRYKILTGDTDATYSGEAMKATIDELLRMERECLLLFTGYEQVVTRSFELEFVPDAAQSQKFEFVRIGGSPMFIELQADAVVMPEHQERTIKDKDIQVQYIVGRVPANCTVSVCENSGFELASTRIPVYQAGAEVKYPYYSKF